MVMHFWLQVSVGDCVSVSPEEPNNPVYLARVISMWEEAGEKEFHAMWFSRGGETVLGETSDPSELFLVDICDDSPLAAITGKATVKFQPPPPDWSVAGGREVEEEDERGDFFYYQKFYDQDTARFEDPPMEHLARSADRVCPSCTRSRMKVLVRHKLACF